MMEQQGRLGGIVKEFLANSSAHGLPNISQSNHSFHRVLWIILFFGGVGAVIWQVSKLFIMYVDAPYHVDMELRFKTNLEFPSVTVCNVNSVRRTKLEESDNQFRSYFDANFVPNHNPQPPPAGDSQSDANTTTHDPGSTNSQGTTMPTDTQGTTEEAILSWDQRESREFYQTISEEYKTQQMLINLLANKTTEETQEIGHQLDDMLLYCEWKGYPCSPGNFTRFFHYKYGNCYTFNSDMFDRSAHLYSNRPGPLYGLSLELNAQQGEYMQGITATAGFKVVIHNPNEMPFPEDHGISISPGFETSIGVRVVDIARLGKPWADCVNSVKKDVPFEDFYTTNYGIDYSMTTCEHSCYQWEVLQRCGCANPKYPYPRNSSEQPCALSGDIADSETVQCVRDVDHSYYKGELGCESYCPHGCNERSYIPAMSLGMWPSNAYEHILMKRMENVNQETRESMRGASPKIWIKENVARILVYYQELNYEFIGQKPSYGVIALLSDIGGQLGLWIGVSILTLCEMLECVCVISVFIFRKVFRCGENRVISTPIEKIPLEN